MERPVRTRTNPHSSQPNSTTIQLHDQIVNQLSSDPTSYARIRHALFLHGSSRAALRILVAIVLNHIRRLLVPWFGQFFWHHALEDMKFARSSPHHYLSASASSFSWPWLAVWTAVALYGLPRARALLSQAAIRDIRGDVWMVLYVFAVLTWLESIYVQTCWVGAQLYAYGVLFWSASGTDGRAEEAFLETLLAEQSARVTAQLGLVAELLVHSIAPTLWRGLQGGFLVSLLVHGLVWGMTVHLVRYSNKYFLLLEMSDIFVTSGWAVLGMVYAGLGALASRTEGQRR